MAVLSMQTARQSAYVAGVTAARAEIAVGFRSAGGNSICDGCAGIDCGIRIINFVRCRSNGCTRRDHGVDLTAECRQSK